MCKPYGKQSESLQKSKDFRSEPKRLFQIKIVDLQLW